MKGNREFILESARNDYGPGTQFPVSPNTKLQHGSSFIKIYRSKTNGIINQDTFQIHREKMQQAGQSTAEKPLL